MIQVGMIQVGGREEAFLRPTGGLGTRTEVGGG
jgi:hypothetical protein